MDRGDARPLGVVSSQFWLSTLAGAALAAWQRDATVLLNRGFPASSSVRRTYVTNRRSDAEPAADESAPVFAPPPAPDPARHVRGARHTTSFQSVTGLRSSLRASSL
jgi:hypothetical protein